MKAPLSEQQKLRLAMLLLAAAMFVLWRWTPLLRIP